MATDELYNRIISEYKKCGSVKQTALNVGTTLVRAQRVLITEGLWHSDTSDAVGELFKQGKTTQEIADQLFISVKTVQAYLPYTKGFYSETEKSIDAQKSDSYRHRKQIAASNQVNYVEKEEDVTMAAKITPLSNDTFTMKNRHFAAMKLRLELILDLDRDRMGTLRKYGKVNEGIIREIIVPSGISLHRLNYAIQKVFGWQNSHLHHFTIPGKVFAELTGGSFDGEEDERYSLQTGSFAKWVEYCGTYFRFPSEDFDDLYWDDDYDGSVSVKTWFKRKYNGPNFYFGDSEHFVVARGEATRLFNENPKIMSSSHMFDRAFGKNKPGKAEEIAIRDATIRDAQFYLEGDMDALLERLQLDEVLRAPFEAKTTKAMLKKQMKEREELYNESRKKYIDIGIPVAASPFEIPWLEDEEPVLPITDEIIYRYDYGDGWGVRITCEEKYSINDRIDEAEGGFVRVSLDDQVWIDEAKVFDHNGNQIFDELREIIAEVAYLEKVKCIYADGLSVMDDVGGVFGYVDFLSELHEGDPEEKESCKMWASSMGWTGRKTKPENML